METIQFQQPIFIIIIIICLSFMVSSTSESEASDSFLRSAPTTLDRNSFPDDFLFGAASSAYQSEGAIDVDGRKPSIWDTFTKQNPGKISDHSNGDIAEEFYYRFKGDVALMKEIGLDSFRFSIAWPRILPWGINRAGIDFYNRLIDELITNGIKPLATLFHWDLPQALEDEYGGLLSPKVVNDYHDYVDLCFKEFGDRVKQWITINEPNIFTTFGYGNGATAPGRCSSFAGNCSTGNSATEPYLVAHHLILSHAAAVQLYREKYQSYQKGIIGMTLQTFWMVPKYQTAACREAASRALDFSFGWFAHPITYGRYPNIMRKLAGNRLPKFRREQSKMVRESYDFLGVNYYTARYSDDVLAYDKINVSYMTDSRVNVTTEKNGAPIGEPTGASWLYIYAKGFEDLLLYVKSKYNNPKIYVTENGMADSNNKSLPLSNALNDELRIKYHHLHLSSLLNAIQEGADVRGYYIWSFLDDFEWQFGYTNRYGLIYVDFEDGLNRYFKRSALWYKDFLTKGIISSVEYIASYSSLLN